LLLFVALHKLDPRKKFYGSSFTLLLMVEAVFRFLIEYVRYYEPEMLITPSFTYNHLIAILLFLFGLSLRIYLSKKGPRVIPAA
jgi:prolipoprotein diacylglyceryltransferase